MTHRGGGREGGAKAAREFYRGLLGGAAVLCLVGLVLDAYVDDEGGQLLANEPDPAGCVATVERRIRESIDDVEQKSSGSMRTDGSELGLASYEDDDDIEAVGMRFVDLPIPKGAKIERAYVQFNTDDTTRGANGASGDSSLVIRAQRAGRARRFSNNEYDLSDRELTLASVGWETLARDIEQAAPPSERTPDLQRVIQEVVDLDDWEYGSDLVLVVTGDGRRAVKSYDGSPADAPLLHIEYASEEKLAGPKGPAESTDSTEPAKDAGDAGAVDGQGGGIVQIATTDDYADDGTIDIARPDSQTGDLLVLFLHRTDDYLPFHLDGWTRVAECLGQDGHYGECMTEADCEEWNGNLAYCERFIDGPSRDLGTMVFYRTVASDEPSSYSWGLKGNGPAWAILTTLRGAKTDSPIRSWAGESHGADGDSPDGGSMPDGGSIVVPSVTARAGDMLLVSRVFGDQAREDRKARKGRKGRKGRKNRKARRGRKARKAREVQLEAPFDTMVFESVSGKHGAGYLFGQVLTEGGSTGAHKSENYGGFGGNDVSISLVVKPK
ncbi:MAG: hypothetical protein AAGF11_10210 [Myxococcota bacterium]